MTPDQLPERVKIATFAMVIERSYERVRQLSLSKVLPPIQNGSLPFIPALHAYQRYLRKMPGVEDATDADIGKALTDQARLLKAQADKAEYEAKRLRGELVPVEAVA